jgi:ribosome-binding factor A
VASQRIAQVNALICQELGQALVREIELPHDTLVTISRVETSPDLEHARAWIKIYPVNQTDHVLEIIQSQIYFIQKILNRRLVMKSTPRIVFCLDRSEDQADRILHVLDDLTKP